MVRLRSFLRDSSGNFAIITALVLMPVVLAVGFGIDGSRYYSARANLQDAADTTALALAASPLQNLAALREEGEKFVAANIATEAVGNISIQSFNADAEKIEISLGGEVRTTFMQLANVDVMPVAAATVAMRAPVREIEVALVLDNTWSMSESSGGVTKIDTLKQASLELVKTLMTSDDGPISIGIVPYADYVNIGLSRRDKPWLDIPADYVKPPSSPQVCVTKTTKNSCDVYGEYYDCTTTTDGVLGAPQSCRSCLKSSDKTVAPYQSCSGGGNGTAYKWFGCIGSRYTGTNYLNDLSPTVPYPGFLTTSQECLTEIVPLTKKKAELDTAINGMLINRGNYKPYTYIPAGLIWGQNLLSPTEPFVAAPYDPKNLGPRKIMILMTDGDNTRRLDKTTTDKKGTHVGFNSNAAKALTEFKETNANSKAICEFSKSNKIEIYTVAFMVDNSDARDLLRGCATDDAHYFDAADRSQLLSSFSGIARSISQVRLAR